MRRLLVAWVPLLVVAASACDSSETFRKLDPSWSRMLEQPRADPYGASPVFDDGKAMRMPPPGTVPHDVEATEPPPVTRELLVLGRARFETYCATCHGVLGDGHSVVAEKMKLRRPPAIALDPEIRRYPREKIARTIARGFGLMPSYADELRPHERWAVAAYVKALQMSRSVAAQDLPTDLRDALGKEAP